MERSLDLDEHALQSRWGLHLAVVDRKALKDRRSVNCNWQENWHLPEGL